MSGVAAWQEIPLSEKNGWLVPIGTGQASSAPVVILFVGNRSADLVAQCQASLHSALAEQKIPAFYLAGLEPVDWDRDYSPWPEKDKYTDRAFAGEADRLGKLLTEEFLPKLQCTSPVYLLGYSLGGLAALYYASRYDFAGCGSCSGSFWYPGWLEYLQKHRPGGKIYLSLGGKEKNTRHPLMSQIEADTAAVKKMLSAQVKVKFVHEPGGHSHQIPQRLAHAITWLLSEN